MISLILGVMTLPSVFYATKCIEDSKYTKIYSESEMKVIDLSQKKELDEKGEDFYGLPLEDQFYNFSSLNVSETAMASLLPFFRHAFYFSVIRDNTTIALLTKTFNEKIKCEHCDLVQAFWSFRPTHDNLGICSNCESITPFNIVGGDDEVYPFFKRKTKKEIKNMLLQAQKDAKNSNKEKQMSDREEQIKIKNKYSSSDKHINL